MSAWLDPSNISFDYYDLDGNPITWDEYLAIASQRHEARGANPVGWSSPEFDPTRVAITEIGDVTVSTVWIGLNHSFDPDGPPLIFETMVFGGLLDGEQNRYSTREQALAGHNAMCARVLGLAHADDEV